MQLWLEITWLICCRMKKYREPIKRSIKTLFRQRKGAGPNEWVCTHCGLNFDNSSLLNLHTLTHAAEDVGLDELRKLAAAPSPSDPSSSAGVSYLTFLP